MLEKEILYDLANETVRKYGNLNPDFAVKMSKRFRRKFSSKIEIEIINTLAFHYKEIYSYAKSIYRDYLSLPKGNMLI